MTIKEPVEEINSVSEKADFEVVVSSKKIVVENKVVQKT